MNGLKHSGVTLAVISGLFLISSQTAHASVDVGSLDQAVRPYYIDPGTGSIVIQALIGAVVAGAAMMGIYRVRVKMFLVNLFSRRKGDEESE